MTTRATKKQVKSPATRKVKRTPEPTGVKVYKPTEEEIRELAEIIYHQRINRGDQGSAEEDWLEAEKILRYQ